MSPSALFVTTVPITLEMFLVPFAEHFRGQGWRIDAMANGASKSSRIAGSFDHRYDVAWSRNPLDPRNLIGSAARVRAVVRQGAYDIVHVHTPIAAFVTRYALRSLPPAERPCVIYTAHGFHFYKGQGGAPHALYRSMELLAARWTDYLVTINDEDFSAARALGSIAPNHVRLIPGIGVDTKRFSPDAVSSETARAVRAALNIPPDAFMLTMIAVLGPVKRHAHLFEALAAVSDPRIVTVLVGDGPLESSLREKSVAQGIHDRIRWAGYRRDTPEILAASDALILTSEREGLPRSIMEAMASGKPIIGTRTRGIADAVGDEAGWIVSKDDAAALADAIVSAAADPQECSRRGDLARKRAVERFDVSHIISLYEELYREALS